MFYVGRKLNT